MYRVVAPCLLEVRSQRSSHRGFGIVALAEVASARLSIEKPTQGEWPFFGRLALSSGGLSAEDSQPCRARIDERNSVQLI
jgi:hypothetical protein